MTKKLSKLELLEYYNGILHKQRDEARAIARKLYAENEAMKVRIDGAIKKLHELMEKYEIPYNIYLDFGDILADNFDQEETHE